MGIPFIFLTAKTEQSEIRKGMSLGADDYLTKPFEKFELLSAIESRLNRFSHFQPTYDLQQADGLNQFLNDARQVGDLQSLSTDRKAYTVRRKQYIYSEGDEPLRLFYIKSGRVKTLRSTREGKELITGLYNPGDFFGYLALFDQCDYTDSAVTLEETELVSIPKDDFRHLLLASQAVSGQFIKLLSGHIHEREQQLMGMAYHSLRRRVADSLLALASKQPTGLIKLSRETLAAIIGTAPESLIRTLSEFKQDGLIELLPTGEIRLLELEKLRMAIW